MNMIRYNVNINGIDVQAEYSEQSVQEIFLPFLKKLTDLHKKKQGRVLAMLAAPPGAGKSTLLSFLEYLSGKNDGIDPIQTIGMDGFHLRQEYLLTHTVLKNGIEVPMVKKKARR